MTAPARTFIVIVIFVGLVSPALAKPKTAVQLFSWTWTDIALECERVLGPAGYEAVQISPPQEHAIVPGRPWYERYQPVSFQLLSRSGTQSELTNMVERCRAAGVEVIADAVVNHMAWRPKTANGRDLGSAGSPFASLQFPWFSPADFHICRPGNDLAIRNYQDRFEVQHCELAELPDLNTGSERVQAVQRGFINELFSLGIRGFRVDAAKHVDAAELQKIFQDVQKQAWIYLEIIGGKHEAVKATEYMNLGDITEFSFSETVSHAFLSGRLDGLRDLAQARHLLPSAQSVAFVDNHDNQRGHGSGGNILTFKRPDLYALANVFLLTYGYGTPVVMSSYHFDDPSSGPPAAADGQQLPSLGSDGACNPLWVCEHRWLAIRNAVRFRSVTPEQAPVLRWFDNGAGLLAFGRGDVGFVVLNVQPSAVRHTFQTELPEGRYCNGLTSEWGNPCPDPIAIGADGRFEMDIPARSGVMIHKDLSKKEI